MYANATTPQCTNTAVVKHHITPQGCPQSPAVHSLGPSQSADWGEAPTQCSLAAVLARQIPTTCALQELAGSHPGMDPPLTGTWGDSAARTTVMISSRISPSSCSWSRAHRRQFWQPSPGGSRPGCPNTETSSAGPVKTDFIAHNY